MTRKQQSTGKLERKCEVCGKAFVTMACQVRRGRGRFCSRQCGGKARRTIVAKQPNVQCAYCSNEFYLNNSRKKNSRSGFFFCCREHKDLAQRIGGIKEIQPQHYRGGKDYQIQAFRYLPNRCNRCGYNEHVGILNVHHKDYDRSNNDIDNLEILCPNCHAIEHRIKNKRKTYSRR